LTIAFADDVDDTMSFFITTVIFFAIEDERTGEKRRQKVVRPEIAGARQAKSASATYAPSADFDAMPCRAATLLARAAAYADAIRYAEYAALCGHYARLRRRCWSYLPRHAPMLLPPC